MMVKRNIKVVYCEWFSVNPKKDFLHKKKLLKYELNSQKSLAKKD